MQKISSRLLPHYRAMRHLALFVSVTGMALLFAGTLLLLASPGARPEAPVIGILYLVDSTGDGDLVGPSTNCDDGTGHCTLRAAVEASNLHSGTDGISFNIPTTDPGYSNGVWTINLPRALPGLSDALNINGSGANKLTVQRSAASGTPNFRIFNVTTTGTVNLSGLAIANGLADGNGGGIQNASTGTVNVTNCALIGNQAMNGGGIANASTGQVNVTNSTINQNTAQLSNGSPSGGGVYNPNGTVTVTNSLLETNSAEATTSGFSSFGGGIYNNGTLTITNSTLFLNQALPANQACDGGGIYNIGNATITNSTISGNSVPGGQSGVNADGVQNQGTVQVKSSIIAGNVPRDFRGGPRPASDVVGAFLSSGFNLVGVRDGSTGFTAATDQSGTAAAPLDPKFERIGGFLLVQVQDNGGPTETIALVCGSPAIDKGTSNGLTGNLTTDQRGSGFARTVNDPGISHPSGGDDTDIGAFEFGAGSIMPTSVVSRKFHGSGKPFDIPLPLSCSAIGIECRRNTGSDTTGPNVGHDHELIVTFANNVTVGSANVASSSSSSLPGTVTFSVSNNVVTVDLHNTPNAARLTINLRGVSDGMHTGLVSIPMGVLLGDVNGSGVVTSGDANLCKGQALVPLTNSNFRNDVNVSGSITSGDVNIIKQNALSQLP
jgi:Dockerin type I domain